MKDYIFDIKGIAQIDKAGWLEREYLVEVDPEKVKRYRLGLNRLTDTLRNRNMDMPGGVLRVGDSEYVLRTVGQYKNVQEVQDTVIMANDANYVTRIGDVATVTDGFEEVEIPQRLMEKMPSGFRYGKNAVLMNWTL